MEKTTIISDLLERLDKLEKWREEKKPKQNKKGKEEDEEVCPKCGSDLMFVEKGITYCEKCKDYYEEKEEE